MRFTAEPTAKPEWYEIRSRIAFWLVSLADKIKPGNEAVMCFLLESLMNDMITKNPGMFKVVHPEDYFAESKHTELN
ncbi:MAG: hypothetical protein ACYSR9_11530 [Planctomycetota bacterium]|jgi:hypothetical protein